MRNALGQATVLVTNAIGLPTQVTDAAGRTGSLSYDGTGRLVAMATQDGRIIRFEYDTMARPTALIDASGNRTQYRRDPAGRLQSVVDPDTRTTTFEYDVFGRVAARVMSDGRRYTVSYRRDNLVSQHLPAERGRRDVHL